MLNRQTPPSPPRLYALDGTEQPRGGEGRSATVPRRGVALFGALPAAGLGAWALVCVGLLVAFVDGPARQAEGLSGALCGLAAAGCCVARLFSGPYRSGPRTRLVHERAAFVCAAGALGAFGLAELPVGLGAAAGPLTGVVGPLLLAVLLLGAVAGVLFCSAPDRAPARSLADGAVVGAAVFYAGASLVVGPALLARGANLASVLLGPGADLLALSVLVGCLSARAWRMPFGFRFLVSGGALVLLGALAMGRPGAGPAAAAAAALGCGLVVVSTAASTRRRTSFALLHLGRAAILVVPLAAALLPLLGRSVLGSVSAPGTSPAGAAALGAIALGVFLTGVREADVRRKARGPEPSEVFLGDLVLEVVAPSSGHEPGARTLRSSVRYGADVVCLVESDLLVRYLSDSSSDVFGRTPESVVGRRLDQVGGEASQVLIEALHATPPGQVQRLCWRREARDAYGGHRLAESVIVNLLEEPGVGAYVVTTRDITEEASLETDLRNGALYDPLTGLVNRALFSDRAERALSRRFRLGTRVALFVIEVKGVVAMADRRLDGVDDELLRLVAQRLSMAAPSDATVARLSSNQLAVLVEYVSEADELDAQADQIGVALRRPISLAKGSCVLRAGVGAALSGGSSTVESLLAEAEAEARLSSEHHREAPWRRPAALPSLEGAGEESGQALGAALQRALERGEFELHYQPAFDVVTGTVQGFEALLRWNRPGRGMLEPEHFVPIAEECGMLVHIGRFVINEALEHLRRVDAVTTRPGELTVSVNLSSGQLHDPRVIEDIQAALDEKKIAPHRLTLEVSEEALDSGAAHVLEALTRLRSIGVRLAVDNFGSGLRSLSLLQRLPIDILKIDQSFVAAASDGRGRAFLQATIELARNLALTTIGEGAEEPAHLRTLCALGCDLVQGYLLSRPITAAEAVAIVRQPGGDEATIEPILSEWLRRRAPREDELVAT